MRNQPLLCTSKMKKALHYNYYFIPAILLATLGVVDTSYLAFTHYKNYTDITYASFCAISPSFNCDTVAQSSWSIMFGIPVALWGLFGYLLYVSLLIIVRKHTDDTLPIWSILQLLGFIYSIIAITLGVISAKKIHSYCLMCILSYTISFLLFFYPCIIRNRFYKKSLARGLKETIPFIKTNWFLKISILFLLILITVTHVLLPRYWIHEYPSNFSTVATGLTEDGHPWIGAEKPKLTIEEFTDYQCFQCGKSHYFLRKLVEKYPGQIRLIHRNFPLDHRYNPILAGKPFHVGSGEMALLAIYAISREKFWQMNDELYRYVQTSHASSLDLNILGKKLSLPVEEMAAALHSPILYNKLITDIQKGLQSGITATPAYIVNGQVYIGSIPSSALQDLNQ